jgi:uncharacterized lipoprotein YehR (DUF1307 family)
MKNNLFKKVIVILMLLVLTFSFVACGKKQTIVGTWEQTGSESKDEYVFNEDNTGTYTKSMLSPINFTYATEGDKVTISMTILNQKDVKSYNYKLDNNKLTMTIDGNDVTFEKK